MSIEAINWALNHAPIPTDRKDASTLAITLLALANHAGPDGRDAFPSVDRMMRYTRLSRRTVQRSLRSLEELGLIRGGNSRVRDANIPEANSRPQVYNLVLSAKLSTGSDEERQDDAPLTSRERHRSAWGRQQQPTGVSPRRPNRPSTIQETVPRRAHPMGARRCRPSGGTATPAPVSRSAPAWSGWMTIACGRCRARAARRSGAGHPMIRVHLTYAESATPEHPGGWTSPAHCLENREAAEWLREATNLLSGRSAAARRTWHIVDCPGENCGVRQ